MKRWLSAMSLSFFLLNPLPGAGQVVQDDKVVEIESGPSVPGGTDEKTLKDLHEILLKQLQDQRKSPEEIKAELKKMQLLEERIRAKEKVLRSQTEGLQRYSEEMQKRLRAPSDFGPADWGMGGVQYGGGGGGVGGVFQSGGGYGGHSQAMPESELTLRAINLSSAIPENMLSMVKPMLGPNGVYSYDARSNVVILVAPSQELDRGALFIEQLSDAYGEALKKAPPREESFSEAPGIQAVRIEALLLKGEDEVVDATIARMQEAIDNLQVEIEKRLQETELMKVQGRVDEARDEMARVEGLRRDMASVQEHMMKTEKQLIARGRKSQESSAGETELSQEALNMGLTPQDLSPFAFPSVSSVGATIVQTVFDPSARGWEVQATVGDYRFTFRNATESLEVSVSFERKFQVRSARVGETGELMTDRVQKVEPLRGKAKIVFNRPILVGSFTGAEGETLILVLRLKKLD
ncbi:MAG: hypothetical protein GHCLOJNM_02685 [bacterium]|nr:hypothetical protein [bacterium]